MEIHIGFSPSLDEKVASFRKLADSGIYESLARYGARADEALLAALQAAAPVKTGAFRDSIRSIQHGGEGQIVYEYTAADPLNRFIIEGTAPHPIEPVKAGALYFIGANGEVFARHVDHPGTQPNDFPRRAWEDARSEIEDGLRQMGRELIEQVI